MNGYPVTLDQVQDPKDRELRERKAREKIAEYLSHFHNGKLRATTLFSKVKILGNLAEQYVVLGEVEPMREHLHSLIKAIREDLPKIEELKPEHLNSIMWWFRRAHVFLAPHEFPAYLKVMEWGFPEENKFFANRICVMGEWAKELEKLEFGEYDLLGLSAPPRSGKLQGMSAKILTPTGWTTMGEIHEGSMVINADGTASEVLGVFPQGERDLYRVTFDDQTYVDCGLEHYWEVQTRDDRRNKKCRVVTTADMMKNLYVENGTRKNYSIDYVAPVEFESQLTEDDLHPYLLGTLIGDGCLSGLYGIGFSNQDVPLLERLAKLLPETDQLKTDKVTVKDHVITCKDITRGKRTITITKLREYGLMGHRAETKFIPKKYLYASKEQRIELLRGLMDTDGYCNAENNSYCEYVTTSKQLAEDVMELIRSLGGRAVMSEKETHYTLNGKRHPGQKAYRIALNMTINPFWLPRKAERFIPREKRAVKYIASIEKIGREECQCIYVNHPRHLYVTDGYNLTHNTGIGSLFLTWLMGRHPEKSMLFATHTGRMARKEFLDIYNLITDPRRCWNEIFRGLEVNKSAEDLWIDVTPKKAPNNYKTFYCTSIDAQKAGVMEASHLIYCDDLIGGIEEAMNPVRLDTAWEKYTTDILQRKNGFVKILHIATRWSVRDPLTRIADTNENNPRAKFICVPGLNEDGESNFNFKHNPLDTQHFMTLKESMDPVSFACIVQQSPVERDGIVFTKDSLSYYDGVLPGTEPDEIVFSADIAFGGGDYLCMLIAYVYGMDVYVHDVVYSKGTKEETRPLVVSAIMAHGCSRGFMEANAGGEDYADNISARLKKEGYRCLIESKRAPVTKTKLNRILEAQSEIKANITDGSGFRLHFLSPRTAPRTPMYEEYMRHLTTFNQGAKFVGKQKDDAADATASLVTNVLYRHSKSPTLQIIRGNILAL